MLNQVSIIISIVCLICPSRKGSAKSMKRRGQEHKSAVEDVRIYLSSFQPAAHLVTLSMRHVAGDAGLLMHHKDDSQEPLRTWPTA